MVKFFLLYLFLTILTQSWSTDITIQYNSLFVKNKKILQILTSKDGIPPLKRIKNIKKNLTNAYLNPLCSIKTISKGNCIHLIVNDHFITSITLKEAKRQNCTQKKLAEQWKNNLIRALYQPPFSFPKETFFIAEQSFLEIKPIKNSIQNIQIINHTPEIIDANYKQNTLIISSKTLGKGIVKVILGSYKKTLVFEVLPLAGKIPDHINTYIVGQNHSLKKLRMIIHKNIQRACKTIPDAKINTSFDSITLEKLTETYSLKVLVTVKAPNALTVTQQVTVSIENLGMPHKTDEMLWYCNYPESIKKFGDIASIKLNSDCPTRVLFHHVNNMPNKLGIQFLIKNYSEHPTKLILIHGEGDPHIDPVKVGQEAAKRFMRTYHENSGDVIEIPSQHEIPLAIQQLNPNETISGLFSIRLLPTGSQNIYITAQALSPYQLQDSWKNSIGKPFPWHTANPLPITREKESWSLSSHLYPTPQKKIDVKYQIGGPFCFVRIGEIPIRGIQQKLLEGNFGVTYHIKASITNPTSKSISVEAVFEASAGYSSGVFIINHQFKTAPLLPSKKEFILKKITLQPFQNRIIDITTLPISGSSYPATITIRPV